MPASGSSALIVEPGAILGGLLSHVAEATGLPRATPVAVVASHDTASAVVAVPFEAGTTAAYISSGTWSLVGVEVDAPVLSEQARAANLTNERGFGGTTRLLKNVMGLWLVQECRRAWIAEGTSPSYADMESCTDGASGRAALRSGPPRAAPPGRHAGSDPQRLRAAGRSRRTSGQQSSARSSRASPASTAWCSRRSRT